MVKEDVQPSVTTFASFLGQVASIKKLRAGELVSVNFFNFNINLIQVLIIA